MKKLTTFVVSLLFAHPSFSADYSMISGLDEIGDTNIHDILRHPEGGYWIATRDTGVHLWLDGNLVKSYSEDDGLAANGVLDLEYDHQGQLWAVGGRGASYFDGINWNKKDSFGDFSTNVVFNQSITENGRMLLGANGGAIIVGSDGGHKLITVDEGLPGKVVHDFIEWPGVGYLVATRNGGLGLLGKHGPKAFFTDMNIRSLLPGAKGTIWAGTGADGILEINADEVVQHAPDQSWQPVYMDDEGKLFSRSDSGGLLVRCDGRWFVVKDSLFPTNNNIVHSVASTENGDVLIGLKGKVIKLSEAELNSSLIPVELEMAIYEKLVPPHGLEPRTY